MSQVDTAHAWWSRLRHQGLLLSPVVMLERYPSAPEPAPSRRLTSCGTPKPGSPPRSPPRGNRTWTKGRSSPGSMPCSMATWVTSGGGWYGRTPSPRSSLPSSASAAAPRRSARTGSSMPTPMPPCPPCWSWRIHRLRSVGGGDARRMPGSWNFCGALGIGSGC